MSLSLLLNREHGSIIYSSGNKSGLSNLSQEKLYEFIETLTPDKDIRAILKSIYSVLMRNSIKMNGISDIELANFLASSCYFDEILDSFSESSISESLRVLK